MKKIYLSMLAIFAMSTAFAQFNLTLQVDMTGQTISTNGVHVAGSFQGWNPSSTAMTQVGTTNIYSVTVSVAAGTYEFKFLNGNAWGSDEGVPAECNVGNGNGNRWVVVTGATTTEPVLFGQCAPTGKSSIQFVVDMSQLTNINDTVSVAGDFQGWTPGATQMYEIGNTLDQYRHIAYVTTGTTVNFKYINGAAWSVSESVPGSCAVGGNRQLVVSSNMIAGPTCYNMCGPCFIPDTFYVTIQVDLQNVCDTIDYVDIAGPLNGWGGGDTLTFNSTTGYYEGTFYMPEPTFMYKARYFTPGSTSPNWEGGANKEPIYSSDTTLPARCFGADVYGACAPKPAPADITFRVDFTQAAVTPATDIYLIADFTGWQGGAIKLDPTPGHPGVFETVVTNFCPANMNFKFVNGDVSVPANEEGAHLANCGVPSGTGSFNRYFARPDANPHTLQFIFDSCQVIYIGLDENVVNQPLSITPNPFSATAVVDLGADTYTVTILDITGRTINVVNNATGKLEITRENMQTGLYIMNAVNSKGEMRTTKFVVE